MYNRPMNPKILIVEDDTDFQHYLRNLLLEHGFLVEIASKGSQALAAVQKHEPDLVVLDLTLPDMQGEDVCRLIREQSSSLPIIMLTAKNKTNQKIEGLSLGADDYITKPFVPEELLARIKARLRKSNPNQVRLKIADLELDTQTVTVKRQHKSISLTPYEFKLLEYLMLNKGVVLSREMILNRVWAYAPDIESRVVDVYIGYLRKKVDQGFKKQLIHSIRGFGYTIKD
jgi:DNA-binding response OmpR family regulator